MNLARPSSTGSASELTVLAGRISEQQCCIEIDSVSEVHRAPTWRDILTHLFSQKTKITCRVRVFPVLLHQQRQVPARLIMSCEGIASSF